MSNQDTTRVAARAPKGEVIRNPVRGGYSFALRFAAYGKRRYVTLGRPQDGWTERRAQDELLSTLAAVRAGTWQPQAAPLAEPAPEPTFHEFASEWFEATRGEWRQNTRLDYEWQLKVHLLPYFEHHRLSQITVAEVDRYRESKVRQNRAIEAAARSDKPLTHTYSDRLGKRYRRPLRPLSATSINKTITRLGQILEVAAERELIARNPVKVGGKRRRMKASTPTRAHLDRAEQIAALLDAAGRLDAERTRPDQRLPRRAMVATLVFAGLRPTEQLRLCWRDVDLAAGRLRVRASKTDAGVRDVAIVPVLRDVLIEHKAACESAERDTGPDGIVFASAVGTHLDHNRLNKRVMRDVVAAANRQLVEDGEVPLPQGLTPRSMRYTFASVLYALGRDPRHVMGQMGHTDPKLALRIYAQVMDLGDSDRERLRALVEGGYPAVSGSGAASGAPAEAVELPANPVNSGLQGA
jgi:integrase